MSLKQIRQFAGRGVVLGLLTVIAACSTPRYSAEPSPHYKVGEPYKINGQWYRPSADPDYEAVGTASWYGPGFHGRKTANGEIFDMNRLSAAHTTLPLPSLVEVTNLDNGRKAVLRVNDRGPFARGRILDVSRAAARALDFEREGTARVRVRYLRPGALAAMAPKENRPAPARKPKPARDRAPRGETDLILAALQAPDAPQQQPRQQQSRRQARETDGAEQTDEGRLYLIRIAALSDLGNLAQLKSALGGTGPLRVSRADLDDGRTVYRINMGPFSSRENALQRLDAVRATGYADAALIALTP